MEKVKLLWDFRGADANAIAAHHLIHLVEFSEKEKIPFFDKGIDAHSVEFQSAFIIVDMEMLDVLKTALKPHRGFKVL